MRDRIESLVSKVLEKAGVDIRYIENIDGNPKMFTNVLEGAISVKDPINIVQVGANDGKYNDPLYEFVKENKNNTNIILIEPQERVVPYLKENYEYHPSTEILNKAVGNEQDTSIQLYRIKTKYWGNISIKNDWPDYRTPTGATTGNRDRLIQWVSKNIKSDSKPEQIIEEFEVQVVKPGDVIDQSDIMKEVQVLQVDAEGMDDKIVYSFFEDGICPNIINIENTELNGNREAEYEKTLSKHGYNIYDYKHTEKIAIKHGI